jgi:hypothetical protein
MNPRLLRPTSSSVHPEANAWRSAVVANGGSVSATTLRAVSKFCADIDAAGIRDRFYRLNLFCGTGLNAVIVPLYRGQSRTGTQYGNTTDTNLGPFVEGDYNETGASGGLKGNGSNKGLETGVASNILPLGNVHFSAWCLSQSAGAGRCQLGAFANPGGVVNQLSVFQNSSAFSEGGVSVPGDPGNLAGWLLGTSTSTTDRKHYRNGTQDGSSTTLLDVANYNTVIIRAFTRNVGAGSFNSTSDSRLSGYSFGAGMTGSQVSAAYAAWLAYNQALGRS